MYEWPPVSGDVTWTHAPVLVHVLLRTVAVVPAVLSFSLAVAQSYVTESGHVTRYQKLSVPPLLGTLNVWLIELSPLVGVARPRTAE